MRHLIKPAVVLLSIAMACGHAHAQDDDTPPPSGDRMKEIKAQKAAYLTTKLGLTSEEAQRFWPVYNEYDEAREKLRKEMRGTNQPAGKSESTLTDAAASELIAKHLADREKELDLERSYTDRFVKNIGAVKTLQLSKAERDFNREVLRRYRERMEGKRDRRPGTPERRH